PMGLDESIEPNSAYGHAQEISTGKDTTSGHWEITGAPVLYECGYFKEKQNSFPKALLDHIVERTGISGYLGNCHSSG
ncbi:phosphopentomutase, partial [Psychromonas aquatilis]